MTRTGRYGVLAIVLGMSACLDRCGDKKTGEQGASASGGGNVAGESLILAAQRDGAFLPPELADPRYADESTLPMGPFQLPPMNFAQAPTETEPNNTQPTATPVSGSLAVRGTIASGDYDYFAFETVGEPQLYAIEAVGKSVGNLVYEAPGNEVSAPARQVDSSTMVIPNLYLAAGKHSIVVRPSYVPGPYTLRAVPMGKPDLRMEREPNDAPQFAHPLRSGIPRVGLLLDRADTDYYTFALRDAARVLLQASSPPDIALMLNVSRTGGPSHSITARAKGESVRMELMLPPGEYVAQLKGSDNGSRTPYKLRLEILDPFAPSADREPNNDYKQAAPMPADLVLRGSVGEYSDADWYELPRLSQQTSMRVQVLGMTGGMNPRSSVFVTDRTGDQARNLNWAMTDSIWGMTLPANSPLFMQVYGRGDYHLRFSFSPGIPPIPGKAPFTISLPPGPHLVEAFSTLAQRQQFPVTIHNPGTQRIEVSLEGHVSHSAWRVAPGRRTVTVEPGKQIQVPLLLSLPPDAAAGEAIQVAIQAKSTAGSTSATTKVYALCGATPANAHVHDPLPASMLGGLNLAAASLGARPVTIAGKLSREQLLYDGMTPSDRSWSGDRTTSDPEIALAVALAGNRPATITGITLFPGNSRADEQVDQFDVLVSEDGQTYRQVLSGRLRTTLVEQAFAFAAPVQARFAQLRVRSNHGGSTTGRATLGEWKVIGAPGEHPFPSTVVNLADPSLGGHVVWSQPLFASGDRVLTDAADGTPMRLDPGNPNEWVVGFHHNRAAQISRLEWVQPAVSPGLAKTLSAVEVSVSTESPVGPWTAVGSWKITPTLGSTTPLVLDQPVWARFVRFSTTEPQKTIEYWSLAESIRIFERDVDATYRSVLGEWGHYARPAIYERMVVAPAAANVEVVNGNTTRDDAKKVETARSYRGRVTVGEDEDWYRIDVPRDHNRLRVNIQGDPVLRAVASLQDESGKTVPFEATPEPGGVTRVEAIVPGGETYFLKLVEPPRSIAVVWDNSSSIRNFTTTIYRALSRFSEAVQPRREFVNLLPLQLVNPKFLMPSWSDQPYAIQGAVQNYNRMDASSNAELGLLAATEALEQRQGSKAILLITDANSDGYPKTSELWAALSRAAVRVFSVELQLGNLVDKQQQLMEDWASANDGHYSTFTNNQDLDVAFERTSCYLRRPARFTLNVETRFEELPAPGGLEVALAADALAQNAVEIILDASGSMLQRLGNSRRMDVARNTLIELVEKTLPVGTPFAFRAFGTRMANCESDLLQKLQPLDRARVGGMVRKLNATNMAKTPIGASLRAVAEDLKGVTGRKTVVLLTDGEETCGGDPAAAIQYLKQQGLDVGVNIVGFAVDDSTLKVSFERWAELGGGRFFDAKNGQELSKALTDAMRPKFQVTDATGSVVAEGTAGGAAVELPVGTYTVRVLTAPVRTFERVRITSKARQRIEVKGGG